MMRRLLVAVALFVAGCGHSEPCCDSLTGTSGPFSEVAPIRLTFASGANLWPAFSFDGQSLAYRFDRGSPDRDRCAGLLPAGGGQQIAAICAWELSEPTRTDLFGSLTPLHGNTVAFVRTGSGLGALGPQEGGLYVAQLDRIREGTKVLSLFTTPAGASARYDFLMRPVRTGPDQLLALAGQLIVGRRVDGGPIDTLYNGVEVVKIDLGTGTAVLTPIADATGAVDWAYDEAAGMVYLHRPTYAPPTPVSQYQVIADTILRVPVTGGTPVVFWGQPPSMVPGVTFGPSVTGLAAADGRVWVSHYFIRIPPVIPPAPPQPPESHSVISEIHGDGSAAEVPGTFRLAPPGNHWARLAASPSADRLAAELTLGTTRDLYLLDLP